MKYISSETLQSVTDALNFSTADCHIIGSCDLYTTKAAGTDKKLYKDIEKELETQYASLVQFSKSLSPSQDPIDAKRKKPPPPAKPLIDLSRDSPFGSFNEISARRTFAYLIATLNASHPDYDFANTLRPSDFRRTSGTWIKSVIDSTLNNLRPRRLTSSQSPPAKHPLSVSAPTSLLPMPEVVWDESMWHRLDKEMDLKHCEKYTWEPEDDPFIEDNSLWGKHFLFFNKDKKRVCYLHFSAFSVISHSPLRTDHAGAMLARRRRSSVRDGASKRAQYWLGVEVLQEEEALSDDSWDEQGDGVDDMVTDEYSEGEYTEDLDDVREHIEEGHYQYIEPEPWVPSRHGQDQPWQQGETLADAMEL